MRQRRFIVLGLSLAAATFSATALYALDYPSVFGCSLNPANNPEACLNNKINDINRDAGKKIAEANNKLKTAEDKLKQLENSPNFARLRGEQLMLQSVRNLQLEPLIMCMEANRAQVDLNAYVQRAAANPGDLSRAILDDIWRQFEGDFDRLMAEEMRALSHASPDQALRAAVSPDAIMTKLTRLADRHAGARCLVQYLAPRMDSFRQSGLAIHAAMETKASALIESKVLPVINQVIARTMSTIIVELRGVVAQGASTWAQEAQAPPPAPRYATGSQQGGSSTPAFSAPVQGIPPPPQKGSIVPQQAIQEPQPMQQPFGGIIKRGLGDPDPIEVEGEVSSRGLRENVRFAWDYVGPTSVTQIGTGIFAKHLLDPARIDQTSAALRRLTSAPKGSEEQARAFQEVQRLVQLNYQIPAEVYIDATFEMLRHLGHFYIDSSIPGGGTFLVKLGVSQATNVKDMLGALGLKLCSLPPAVAINCTFAKEAADYLFTNAFIPGSTAAIVFGLDKAWDGFIAFNKFDYKYKNKDTDEQRLRARREQAGIFAPILDQLQDDVIMTIAEPAVRDARLALQRYNAAVLEMAQAIVRR